MAGLISSLHNSSGALRVHSKGLEVTGKNLANINNRGYAKQRVEIGDRGQINTGIATESMGVEAMGLRQNRDALLDKSVMRELTATADLEAAKTVLQNAETALGQFLDRTKDSTSIQNAGGASGGGISDALTDFFNAWESFSVKPNDIGEKQLLIAKAQILAEKISQTDERLAGVQDNVDSQVAVDVDIVNQILDEIAEINNYIAKAELTKPYSAVDLRDKRQAKLEELSKYVDVTFSNFDNDPKKNLGRIVVELNGLTLPDGSKPLLIKGDEGESAPQNKFSYDADTNYLSLGGSAFEISDLPDGKLGAQIKAAYDTVQDTRIDINNLAEKLASEVNGVYQEKGGVGNIFNLSTSASGLLQLSYNSDLKLVAGSSGGNAIALAVAELGTKIYTPTDAASFQSTDPHGFADGDKVYTTENGLMWIAAGIDPAKLDITPESEFYIVEKVSPTAFNLKTNSDPAVYIDETVATSPITTVTKYDENGAISPLKANVVPYITEFSFPGAAFQDGDEIQFSSLPGETPDSILDRKLVYTLDETDAGKFRILKPDGSPLQITEDDLKGVDRAFLGSAVKAVSSSAVGVTAEISAKSYGSNFYGDFELSPSTFSAGDQVKFTNPSGSVFNEQDIFTINVIHVNADGAEVDENAAGAIKVFQFSDINGNPLQGIGPNDVNSNTRVSLLEVPNNQEFQIKEEGFDPINGQFWGEIELSDPSGFAVGQSVSIQNPPPNSVLTADTEYKISAINLVDGKNLLTLVDANGDSLTINPSDIGVDTALVFDEVVSEGNLISFNRIQDFESSFSGSFSSYFNSLVTSVAQELNTTNTRLEDQKLSEEMAVNSRDQYSGVSQDEEITDMMKFQRSFQASARHINVIDTLLEQVVNRLGVG